MTIAKKVLAVIVMALSVVVLLLSLGGAIATWLIVPPLNRDLVALLSRLEKPLMVAETGLSAIGDRTAGARSAVASVNDTLHQAGQKVIDSNVALGVVQATVGKRVGPEVLSALDTASSIAESVVAINSTLETMNRIPGVDVPTLTPQLTQIRATTSEAMAAVQDLQAQLQDLKAGLVGDATDALTARTARVDSILAQIQTSVTGYSADVAAVKARVIALETSIPRAITTGAVLLTLLLLASAAGQVSLFIHMLVWFKRV